MDRRQVDDYLARIQVARPVGVDAGALRKLQVHHLMAVPFENLSIHLGEGVVLDESALIEKLVYRRRGGFCYELNGAFAALLSALGFTVTLLAARVHGPDGWGPLFDHLALRVDASERWLVDVGFGRFSHHPLNVDVRSQQCDPGGTFRIADAADGDLDIFMDGEPQYRIESRSRRLRDFEPTSWWQQTSPESHFTRSLVCSRLTENGQITLSDRTLVQTTDGKRQEHLLNGDDEVLAAYRTHFGIVLDRVPSLVAIPMPR